MKEIVRVLLIGAAFSADLHADAYARIRDRAQIVAIADKDTGRIDSLAKRYGFTGFRRFADYHEAIRQTDCDLVDICLPNFLHYDAAMAALTQGRDIISEKPLAISVGQAQEMVDTARRLGRHIYYAEDWLGSPALRKALAIVESGGIGQVKYIRAREAHCGSHSPFAQKLQYCGGGCMLHLGIHPAGFLLALKGNTWQDLTALTSGGGGTNLIHTDMEGEDWAGALLRFADGTAAEIEANYVTSGGMEDQIDFYGTQGCLHVDLTFSSPIRAFSIPGLDYTVEKAEQTSGWSRPAVDEKYTLGYAAEIAHFVDCEARSAAARRGLTGEDGLAALQMVTEIYRSAQQGVRVRHAQEVQE